MAKIGAKNIFKQIYNDLVGKDSQRGVSLTYAWLCNQWGHIALGFIPAIFMGVFGNMSFFGLPNIVVAGLMISVIATLFEIYNFLWPLLSKKKNMVFAPDWKNVGFDTFTDLVFFYIGGLSAIQVLKNIYSVEVDFVFTLALILCGVYVAVVFYYWYTCKILLQTALFPFQFRLSQWTGKIDEDEKNTIIDIIKHKEKKHILLFGSEASGKTSLAIGIATDLAIKRKATYYTTAIKMNESFLLSNIELRNKLKYNLYRLWIWRDCDCLVIDDYNSGGSIPDIITPDEVEKIILNENTKTENINALKNQTVIWVVGSFDNKEAWINFIQKIGIEQENIDCIEL